MLSALLLFGVDPTRTKWENFSARWALNLTARLCGSSSSPTILSTSGNLECPRRERTDADLAFPDLCKR